LEQGPDFGPSLYIMDSNVDGGYSGSIILPNRMYGREGDDSMMLLGPGIIDVLEYEV
jgi:hypothetical protein